MKYLIYILSFIILASCAKIDNTKNKESCDFTICEEGRNNIDTVSNAYGVLSNNGQYYIKATANSYSYDTLYISCLPDELILPEIGNYVKFSGFIKDACSKEVSSSTDSIFLNEIKLVQPSIQETCEQEIMQEGFDIKKNDENLSIIDLNIVDDCLQILVSYTGNCDQIPKLSLHMGEDILFGDIQIVVSLQGTITEDCNKVNTAVLKYNLTPIWDDLSDVGIQEVILYFQSQGGLKISYAKSE